MDGNIKFNSRKPSLKDYVLLGGKGYISSKCKIDLFHTVKIELITPKWRNLSDLGRYLYVFSKSRKRIETQFYQLNDPFLHKRNYATSVLGFCTYICSKITAFPILQYFKQSNGKQLNHICLTIISQPVINIKLV